MLTRKIAQEAPARNGEQPATPGGAFSIVGIGASAGDLGALTLWQGRSTQLDGARTLESVPRQAQAVLEQRIAQLIMEGRRGSDPLLMARK